MDSYKKIQDERNTPPAVVANRFFKTPPFEQSKSIASQLGADLAIPNGRGIGNVLCFSRLVESFSKTIGRRISIATSPINPAVGIVENERAFPIWENNPFIKEIKNCDEFDKSLIEIINAEQDNCCQFNHFIQNICLAYEVPCDSLRPSLFLKTEEMSWAMDTLSSLRRPLVCMHIGGTSSPYSDDPWYVENWKSLVNNNHNMEFIQLGKQGFDIKEVGIQCYKTSIREVMSLIWGCDIFIGFDSALAHIATAFQKPTAVLWDVERKNNIEEPYQKGFGPSALTRWSYPQNKNYMMLGEKDNELIKLLNFFLEEEHRRYKFGLSGV